MALHHCKQQCHQQQSTVTAVGSASVESWAGTPVCVLSVHRVWGMPTLLGAYTRSAGLHGPRAVCIGHLLDFWCSGVASLMVLDRGWATAVLEVVARAVAWATTFSGLAERRLEGTATGATEGATACASLLLMDCFSMVAIALCVICEEEGLCVVCNNRCAWQGRYTAPKAFLRGVM